MISDVGERETPRLPAGMAGVFQSKKYRYGLDMKGFWLRDKCRIIAVNRYIQIFNLQIQEGHEKRQNHCVPIIHL
jgi:hypothetical protein